MTFLISTITFPILFLKEKTNKKWKIKMNEELQQNIQKEEEEEKDTKNFIHGESERGQIQNAEDTDKKINKRQRKKSKDKNDHECI